MSLIFLAITGFLGGMASGLFGVGGGTVFVPLLIILLSFNAHLAIGTSIAVVVPTALMAAFKHGSAGMIDWKTAMTLTAFAIIGAWIGAGLSLNLNVVLLKRCYALFLMLISLKLFFQN